MPWCRKYRRLSVDGLQQVAKRVDANQKEIVEVLRSAGATVQHLHTIGKGCPDLVVGYRGQNYMLEIKTTPVGWKLTPDESKWHRLWQGQVCVVGSIVEALQAIGLNVEHYKGVGL